MSENDHEEVKPSEWKYTSTDSPSGEGLVAENDNADDQQSPSASEEQTDQPTETSAEELSWSSFDSFSSGKSISWYLILAVLTVVLCAIIYLLTRDKITTGVVLVSGLLIGFYAAKKPKIINYQINKQGFKIGEKYYKLADFRSFSIDQHGENLSAVLVPLRRFLPYTYINFTKDMEEKITAILADTLPKQTMRLDFIETTLRRIGF